MRPGPATRAQLVLVLVLLVLFIVGIAYLEMSR